MVGVMVLEASLLISFLASQFGLNKLPKALKKTIGAIPAEIENKLRTALRAYAKKAGGGTAVKEKNSSLLSNKNNSDVFNYEGSQYRLVISAESRGATSVKIFRLEAGQADKVVGKPLTESDFLSSDADARQKFRDLVNSAEALRKAAMKPAAGQPKPTFAQLKALKADLNAKRTILVQEIVTDHSCITLGAGCFGAGTKLWTELGYRNIEDIQPGERVYSRDQWDENGEIAAKIVEEVFTRFAGIWEVVAGGQTIRTTMEHPFFVVGKGWTVAHELRANDKLLCADGTTVSVDSITDTGNWEVVYNLRVAEWHTYFVGDEGWGWAAWAHNTYSEKLRLEFTKEAKKVWMTRPAADRPKRLADWNYDWWHRFGKMSTPAPDHSKFAFGVANSLGRGGASKQQVEEVLRVICGLEVIVIGQGANTENLIQAALEDAFRPSYRREKLVGPTPTKDTTVGDAVLSRMALEINPWVPGKMMAYEDDEGQWWVYSVRPRKAGPTIPPSGYYKLEDCQMGHHPADAVVWWNQTGKSLPRLPNGGPGPEIRWWMENPAYYQLQLDRHNASAGGSLSSTAPYWVAPTWVPPNNP